MDVSHIFDPLNEAQREAVAAPPGPLLVLAGAGSGKTRVLTHRIAWLIQAHDISPLSILAVTFTNKASREMRGRIEELLQTQFGGMWMGTFHGLCHRLLRMHYDQAGLPQSFEIIDSDDQYRLIRRVLRELDLDEAYWPPRQMQWMINSHKEEARRPQHLPVGNDSQQQTLHRIYATYEEFCHRFGLVDFAEILLRTLEMFRNNQTVRETYQQRFQHVLVDEFQDTNSIQYQWVKLLSAQHKNLFAVGDDDQSIYGWRGARVENLLSFEKDFDNATVFRLEQNYRSTGNILNAANAVIANNAGRLGKELWTDESEGCPIRLYAASNEIDEARFVVDQIQNWVSQGNRRDQSAILYRSNAQSRVFEEQLLSTGMPYRVYGGLRFFERAEIKDALAYLRLISNRHSDPAYERIVNLPTRGIGNKTLQIIRERTRLKQISMWQATTEIISEQGLPPRALSALSLFQDLINQLAETTGELDLTETTDQVLKHSGLLDHYKKERGEKAQGRVENLEELINAARNFNADNVAEEMDELSLFLAHAALEAGEGQAQEWEDCVQLMSLHSAKGLEFPLVFLCGLEEGLFPHQRSIEDGQLEEERRLCYVGMTRAMQQLFLCYAEVRHLYGREHYPKESRFLTEIPEQYLEEIRAARFSKPLHRRAVVAGATAAEFNGLKPGRQVRHKKFGDGMVINLEGQGAHARVQVNFADAGPKWLVCAYTNLESV
ncbi:DNA helicase II [Candidatus Spongiihabitans sp.]|uniref:DNA helicase II n=1 Tax=Candidatus Spongiihabitans sp. TaxID=3101308 RepID=UPI003C7B16EA